jgi:hypothetical protein
LLVRADAAALAVVFMDAGPFVLSDEATSQRMK